MSDLHPWNHQSVIIDVTTTWILLHSTAVEAGPRTIYICQVWAYQFQWSVQNDLFFFPRVTIISVYLNFETWSTLLLTFKQWECRLTQLLYTFLEFRWQKNFKDKSKMCDYTVWWKFQSLWWKRLFGIL